MLRLNYISNKTAAFEHEQSSSMSPVTLCSCLVSVLDSGINAGFLMSWIAQIYAIQQAHPVQRVSIKADLTYWHT